MYIVSYKDGGKAKFKKFTDKSQAYSFYNSLFDKPGITHIKIDEVTDCERK